MALVSASVQIADYTECMQEDFWQQRVGCGLD
jgi:hypothetical protein